MESFCILLLILHGICSAKGMILKQAIVFIIGELCCFTGTFLIKKTSLDAVLQLLMRLTFFIQAIGFWFQFQCNFQQDNNQMIEFFFDFLINLAVSVPVYFLFSIGKEKLIFWIGKLSTFLLPFLLLYTRLFSHPVSGSYIQFFHGFLTFGLVLFLWPFASMFLLGQKPGTNLYHRFYALPKNQFFYLLETILLILLACINNDFGTAMLIGATAAILLFIYGRDWICKISFLLFGILGIIGACFISQKLFFRFFVCIHLKECVGTENNYLAQQSEALLYLMQNINVSGPFGAGFGKLPRSIFPNLDTDYVVSAMLYEQGIWMILCIACLILLFIITMLKIEPKQKLQNRLAFMIAFVFAVNMVWIYLGNLSILPICGLSFPFISHGSSTNLAFSLLLTVFLSITKDVHTMNKHKISN